MQSVEDACEVHELHVQGQVTSLAFAIQASAGKLFQPTATSTLLDLCTWNDAFALLRPFEMLKLFAAQV